MRARTTRTASHGAAVGTARTAARAEPALLRLQRLAGNRAVSDLVGGAVTAQRAIRTVAPSRTDATYVVGRLNASQLVAAQNVDDFMRHLKVYRPYFYRRKYVAVRLRDQPAPTRQQAEAEEPNIPAFTLRRKATIYMRQGTDAHVMLHEAFHLLSNGALSNAAGAAADEGATEFFRMQATPVGDRAGHPVHAGYQNAHDAIWTISLRGGDQQLRNAYFQGAVDGLGTWLNMNTVRLDLWRQWLEQPAQHVDLRDLILAKLAAAPAAATGFELWCAMMQAGAAASARRLVSQGGEPPAAWIVQPPPPAQAPAQAPAAHGLVVLPMLQRHLAIPGAGDDELA